WLDEGMGSCLLRDAGARSYLEQALMKFQGERVEHLSWVIMPNHVHLLFVPKAGLSELMRAWKGSSARWIGKGVIWQANYRDTLIRNARHFATVVRYIRKNPVKARLHEGEFTLWESERARAVE
ncbi:transposase, partial [Haloferula sp.]|uniref:transposase n=1 Tax=Haloferula sp. TaxID=2497595 RepID=UPI003C739D15